MKPHILFVDDEPNLLSGLRRLTRGWTDLWDMEFLPTGEAALEVIDRDPVDLVVTDMRMPGMDGAELLERISQKKPGIFRFALSGETDVVQAIRIAGRSHRFLAKPIEPDILFGAINELFDRPSTILENQRKSSVAIFDLLKCKHGRLATLADLVSHPERHDVEIVAQIMSDPSLAVRILQLANSAYFGKPLKTIRIPKAINYIGLQRLAQLVERQRLGAENEAHSEDCIDNNRRAMAAVIARERAAAEDRSEDEQDLAYATALFSGLGEHKGLNSQACAARPACISTLFGLPARLAESLVRFTETSDPPTSEDAMAELAIEAAAKTLEQNKEAA